MGRKLESVTIEDLGRAEKVVSTKDDTTVVGGKGDLAGIKGRIEQIRVEIDKSTSDYDREKLQERLAKLSGGVAIRARGRIDRIDRLHGKKNRYVITDYKSGGSSRFDVSNPFQGGRTVQHIIYFMLN